MPEFTPRYLAPFHPKRAAHCFADVLIIGSGIAGLRAALEIDPSLSVLIVGKHELDYSNSFYAQGGVAVVWDNEDQFEEHVDDTIVAGGSLCNREVVEFVVSQGPKRIQELIDWDTHFDHEQGELVLGREGGHGRRRIAHAYGDATGQEIVRALIEKVQQRSNIRFWTNTFSLDLLTEQGQCHGAVVWNERWGTTLVWTGRTILSTGGAGRMFRESTNPKGATGDGISMAWRAGAELRDMEFFQFHPTVLYIAGGARHLISEAVRGEGAHLLDKNGVRFMPEYDQRAELAPRDVVSRAITEQMEKTRHTNVYLDLSHLDPEAVRNRFPGIAETCSKFGIDIARDRIPVRPGAHYMVGGLVVDIHGRTTLPGLWAAGEVTSTGLHGANRLASNSLLEALVYGAESGRDVSEHVQGKPTDAYKVLPLENPLLEPSDKVIDVDDIRNSLQSLMWRNVGVRRNSEDLVDTVETIEHWRRYVLGRQFQTPRGWELQNMLITTCIIAKAALSRTESRGVHQREDCPETDDTHWNRHQQVSLHG